MTAPERWIVVGRDGEHLALVHLDAALAELKRLHCSASELPAIAGAQPAGARWVWSETTRWYPALVEAGVVVSRSRDLRLCHAILRNSALVTEPGAARAATAWAAAVAVEVQPGASAAAAATAPALFEMEAPATAPGVPEDLESALAELRRQQTALATASQPGRLQLLLAAESAGALLAVELHAAGLPWSRVVHERLLEESLGPRPSPGSLPARLTEVADEVRSALGDPAASLDSQPKLLRSLHRVGVMAQSTSRWELADFDHPAIEPLLRYKKLARLMSANGWAWLDEWAPHGRFRPVYVPGGVVTGRWASSGGGALQLPRQLRPAVAADPGWTLVVADVAQLEPRMLAAMSGDLALAAAARGRDLYDGIVSGGIVSTRQEAKIAMLGAMYGATTGDSARLVPALRRAYPRAMNLVDSAARVGESGGVVTTWLGRSCEAASARWRTVQDRAGGPEATAADQMQARRTARDRGRFTRNFVVQGTAAEWALAWLADVRGQLALLPEVSESGRATASGAIFSGRAHLCFFLHDEIIVHTPQKHAEQVASIVTLAAARAARLLFGDFPLDIPLDLRITSDAAKA